MADDKTISIARYVQGTRSESGGRSETEGTSWQNQPDRETRPQAEKERHPDYYQRQQRERGR